MHTYIHTNIHTNKQTKRHQKKTTCALVQVSQLVQPVEPTPFHRLSRCPYQASYFLHHTYSFRLSHLDAHHLSSTSAHTKSGQESDVDSLADLVCRQVCLSFLRNAFSPAQHCSTVAQPPKGSAHVEATAELTSLPFQQSCTPASKSHHGEVQTCSAVHTTQCLW